MVMSKLTWLVDGGVLLVFFWFYKQGPYIAPDQQGDTVEPKITRLLKKLTLIVTAKKDKPTKQPPMAETTYLKGLGP